MPPDWIGRYIGVSFANRGRSPVEGFDCYGLVWWVLREHYGIEIPSLSEEYESAYEGENIRRLIDLHQPVIAGEKVSIPEPGDIAVITRGGLPIHIGVVVDARYVLHADPREGVVLDRITGFRLRNRIEGFYRVN